MYLGLNADLHKVIEDIPVAYDLDKVVEQLKEYERYIYDAVSDEDNYVIDTEKAIEIVKGAVKMNDEKLTQLNELSKKIKTKKAVLKTIDELSTKSGVVITEYNNGSVRMPEELRNVFFTLLRDFYKKQLDAIEKEFEEM